MNHQIKFIHAADIHLDSPFRGLTNLPKTIFEQVRLSTFNAFDYLINSAIQKEVDFILLVGDLFDHEKQSLKAQIHLKNAFLKLKNHQIQVYLSYGNHDFINGNPYQVSFPQNVHVFPSETVNSFPYYKENEQLAEIYGFSYENRAVTKNKVVEYEKIDGDIPFHLAMLHGSISGNQQHDPYAPFLLSDLYSANFDYWALGHIHKREVLSNNPPIIYPGNTQGRHRSETGEKGFYYIEMKENEVKKEFIKSNVIQFETIEIAMKEEDTIEKIRHQLNDSTSRFISTPTLFYLKFHGDFNHYKMKEEGLFEQLIDIFNEENMLEKQWKYIYRFVFKLNNNPVMGAEHFFIGEIKKALNSLNVSESVNELFNHREMRRFVEPINEQNVKKQAEELLMNELTEGRQTK